MSNRRVRNRYALRRIDGLNDRECSSHDKATINRAAINSSTAEEIKTRVSLVALMPLKMTSESFSSA